MKKLTFLCLAAAAAIATARGTTFNLSNAQADDVAAVQSVLDNQAVSGDVIAIPAGTHNWTNSLKISRQVTLQGPAAAVNAQTATITGGNSTSGQILLLDSDGNGNGAATGTGVADHHTLTVKDLAFVYNNAHSGACVAINGTARYHTNGGSPAGGVHLSNCHFSAANPTGSMTANVIAISDWNSGVVDHCYFDLGQTTQSKAVIDVGGPASAPGTRINGSNFYTIHGVSIQAASGLYSASVPHNWGTIGGDADAAGLGGISEDDQWYFEDNIIEKIGITVSVTDNTSLVNAGGRVVWRHNAIWQWVSGHGFGESGACNSFTVIECYNNVYRVPIGKSPAVTSGAQTHDARTAAWVAFNERYQDQSSALGISITPEYNRPGLPGTPNLIGIADGTNFFDNNHRGSLTWTNKITGSGSFTLSPVVSDLIANGTNDDRIGSVYARGDGGSDGSVLTPVPTGSDASNPVTLKSPVFAGAPKDKFAGFIIRNATASGPAANGCQVAAPVQGKQNSGVVKTSSAADPVTNAITFNLQSSFQSSPSTNNFAIATSDSWEMRYCDEMIGLPGAGWVSGLLTGAAYQGSQGNHPPLDPIHWTVNKTFRTTTDNQIWGGQSNEGLWSWNNLYRQTNISNKALRVAEPTIKLWFKTLAPGGIHGTATSTDGVTGPKPGYPSVNVSGFTTAKKDAYGRIGPDWNSNRFGGRYADGTPVLVDGVTGQAVAQGGVGVTVPTSIPRGSTDTIYGGNVSGSIVAGAVDSEIRGAPYPHPLVTGIIVSSPTITSTSGTTFTACSTCTNSFTVTTGGFTGTPTLSIGSWSPSVSNITFADNGDGTATISGSGNGTTAGDHTATISATGTGGQNAFPQVFTLTVNTPNTNPTCSIATNKTNYSIAETVPISVTSADAEGPVAKVEIYSDDVLIGTVNNPDPTTVFNWSAGSSVPLDFGTHVLKAQATDSASAKSDFSNTISVTVSGEVATPPTIISVKP